MLEREGVRASLTKHRHRSKTGLPEIRDKQQNPKFIETGAALPGGFGTVHAIRLGIEPFAELGTNSESWSGSRVDSPCSCRAILKSAPVTLLRFQFITYPPQLKKSMAQVGFVVERVGPVLSSDPSSGSLNAGPVPPSSGPRARCKSDRSRAGSVARPRCHGDYKYMEGGTVRAGPAPRTPHHQGPRMSLARTLDALDPHPARISAGVPSSIAGRRHCATPPAASRTRVGPCSSESPDRGIADLGLGRRGWPPTPSAVCQNSPSGFGGIVAIFFSCSSVDPPPGTGTAVSGGNRPVFARGSGRVAGAPLRDSRTIWGLFRVPPDSLMGACGDLLGGMTVELHRESSGPSGRDYSHHTGTRIQGADRDEEVSPRCADIPRSRWWYPRTAANERIRIGLQRS